MTPAKVRRRKATTHQPRQPFPIMSSPEEERPIYRRPTDDVLNGFGKEPVWRGWDDQRLVARRYRCLNRRHERKTNTRAPVLLQVGLPPKDQSERAGPRLAKPARRLIGRVAVLARQVLEALPRG